MRRVYILVSILILSCLFVFGQPLQHVYTDKVEAFVASQVGIEYVVDGSEADQGATGNRKSIKAYVDAIGTSRKATIKCLHTSINNETTYTLTTSETITSNITLKMENGAILDGPGTLTINGPFEHGLTQCFDDDFIPVFGDGAVKEVYPEWWGIDGTADEVQINKAITAAANIKCVELQAKTYTCAAPIVISAEMTLTCKSGRAAVTNATTNTVIQVISTLGTSKDLSANADSFQSDIVLEAGGGASYAADEWIIIQDDDDWEYGQIDSIAADTLTMKKKLSHTYETTDAVHSVTKVPFIENIRLENMVLDNGNYAMAVKMYSVKDFVISNVKVQNMPTTAASDMYSFYLRYCYRGNIINCKSIKGSYTPFYASYYCFDVNFYGCYAEGYDGFAYKAMTSTGIHFISCDAENGGYRAFILDAGTTHSSIIGGSAQGMRLDAPLGGSGIVIEGDYNTVMGTVLSDLWVSGVYLSGANYNTIIGVTVRKSCANSYFALRLKSASTHNRIIGCYFDAVQAGSGILFDDDCDYNIFEGNDYSGCIPIDFGTATHNQIKNNISSVSTDVASAATVTLPQDGDYFNITGTTNITTLIASWASRIVTLKFAGILTFTDGNNIKIEGDFVTTADDTITLVCDGTNWHEMGRSTN